ncbi:hypothetical protein A3742_00800 [Oleiphilus sp. HI0071]|jgi:tRNA 2-thiouridine synthesizing protein C|uniref:DsrE family protein n=2 Tax=Oleiphilus TaxID=141450 RepID=UPI0007C2FBDB|nr:MULTISPECIES: DsrE family protein [unclassified Oleiphilus]KZY61310.1 hypothetical protein A3737_15325 [Oleiphilus sp. HI0065]KZY82753.1 hypothetical protein A3742_18045 [Oleiphilus sp. HI0071]KZY93654.1 hypothetical protein A3744_17725 [Oleiphilus sp. HI0073]KZZ40698.1 hypothetical protein A3758_08245 [Oleiphilus sp. HI0118]KZZ48493.1 hypothetical protein A3760_23545 [Oleiphilus sp. HI0122]KZZ70853.1 hypothetical protein A3765_02770 [Oleiphilus sp. HI0130]KZZ82267.1 hypothetical protein 
MSIKSLVIVFTQPPSASSANQEALDLALAAASFDQEVKLVFEGDAIYQLVNSQEPGLVGRKNLSKMMKALPLYGIDLLYIFSGSDTSSQELPENATLLDDQSYQTLLAQSNSVIRF